MIKPKTQERPRTPSENWLLRLKGIFTVGVSNIFFLKFFKPRLNFKVYFFSLAQTFINNEDKK